MRGQAWVKMPSRWIQQADGVNALRHWSWARGEGPGNLAGLMLYVTLVHRFDPEAHGAVPPHAFLAGGQARPGIRLTYDEFEHITGLSRPLVSRGLSVLEQKGLLTREGRSGGASSRYFIAGVSGHEQWAKLPRRSMYTTEGTIRVFSEMKLRSKVELNAMRLFLLLVAFRNSKTNLAHLSYEKISEYLSITHVDIRLAISWLNTQNMIHTEQVASQIHEGRVSSAYRIVHIEPTRHMGTTGRGAFE